MGCLIGEERAQGGPGDVVQRTALDVADALAGALDDPARVVEQGSIRELNVDVRGVRDQPDRKASHPDATWRAEAEGEDAIRQVDLLLGVRHHLARQRAQSAKNVANRRRVGVE